MAMVYNDVRVVAAAVAAVVVGVGVGVGVGVAVKVKVAGVRGRRCWWWSVQRLRIQTWALGVERI